MKLEYQSSDYFKRSSERLLKASDILANIATEMDKSGLDQIPCFWSQSIVDSLDRVVLAAGRLKHQLEQEVEAKLDGRESITENTMKKAQKDKARK